MIKNDPRLKTTMGPHLLLKKKWTIKPAFPNKEHVLMPTSDMTKENSGKGRISEK